MIRRAFLGLILFICLLFLLLTYLAQSNSRYPPSLNRVAVWMPTSWDSARARASWQTNRAHIQELSPVWYQLDASGDGSLNSYDGARDVALVNDAHAQSPPVLVIPLVNNSYAGVGFDAAPVGTMLHDPARRAAHIAVLVNEVLAYGYDGIDIDYESLNGHDDRDAFSLFIEELAVALHDHDKLLSIAVHAKMSEPGPWDGPQAQDWARIGAAVDRFRVMTYGYHWNTSEPGPIAPLWWMGDVIAYATSIVSPNHVYVGIHLYGHDWTDTSASSLTWESAQSLINVHGATRQWKSASSWWRAVAEPWFTYTDDLGQSHEVWYTDGPSVAARLDLVQRYGLGGIAIWRLGGEDPASWSAIATTLH
ncbi:MAG: glycoside hydrolase [Chloroflexi bacterium]|nr:glycoside hydrolase [Chloroflexota bacterium]